MTEQSPGHRPSTTDQILDLLLDALADRQRERAPAPKPPPPVQREREIPPSRPEPPAAEQRRATAPLAPPVAPKVAKPEPRPGEEAWEPPATLPSINMGKLLGRLAILVVILVVAINIPVKSHGVSLARILPDTASLIIRDGLVLKGSGSEIFMLKDNKLRWISSMSTFDHLGLTWDSVHLVDDRLLQQFEVGYPISIIYRCANSPHIYALEEGKKRWIKDIETFTSLGYVWEDVQFVSCAYLRDLPDGLPLPEDAGTPPQP